MNRLYDIAELASLLGSASERESLSVLSNNDYLIVDLATSGTITERSSAELPHPVCPVIGFGAEAVEVPGLIDVIAKDEKDLVDLTAAINRNPSASALLVQLLRHHDSVSVEEGLFAESLAYSTLQHGSEFEGWLAERKTTSNTVDEEPPVLLDRQDNRLTITFNRPGRHNAFSAALRDAFCEALELVEMDETISETIVCGAGPSFSAGGDLDEFGEARDAARAHAVRMTRSTALLVHQLRERLTFRLHGACIGAGIEVPAFAAKIRAREDAFFQLPEVNFGLVPGAGGTVSILRRIGRHKTALLALTSRRISSETALGWGLVDEVF